MTSAWKLKKARAAQEENADTLMELSAAGDMDEIRRTILECTDLPVGNVPLYQAFKETIRRYKNPAKLDPELCSIYMEQQLATTD
ncbi:MAG: phosphomethylpyrimidine synthase ThiC [Desulfotignum sp.]|nr:phosphomethylpyrimidine synthase ThiC [Desulfotignum sp.]